jgi:hypothetical protein
MLLSTCTYPLYFSNWINSRTASATRALLRLIPCYRFYLRPPWQWASGTYGFPELTGGEYKTWERIHRVIADTRLLVIPASWGRVSDLNLNWRIVWRIGSELPRRDPLSMRLYYVCSPGCQRDMLIWRHPLLPPSTLITMKNYLIIINYVQRAGQSRMILITYNKGCVRFPTERNNSSHELTTTMHHLSKCPCGGLSFHKAYTWVSNPGEVFRLPSN